MRSPNVRTKMLWMIQRYEQMNGEPPTVRELQQLMGFKSPRAVSYHIEKALEYGQLEITSRRERNLRVVSMEPQQPREREMERRQKRVEAVRRRAVVKSFSARELQWLHKLALRRREKVQAKEKAKMACVLRPMATERRLVPILFEANGGEEARRLAYAAMPGAGVAAATPSFWVLPPPVESVPVGFVQAA